MSETTRYCEDCRYFEPHSHKDRHRAAEYARCARTTVALAAADLISREVAKPRTRYESAEWYCATQRGNETSFTCGREARFYEPKDASAPPALPRPPLLSRIVGWLRSLVEA